jgi:hypothetical protein
LQQVTGMIDDFCDFFLAHDHRQIARYFWKWQMLAHFVPLERLHVQEAQSRDARLYTAWRKLFLAKQKYLVLGRSSSGPSLSGGLPKCLVNAATTRR